MDFRTFETLHKDLEQTGSATLFAYVEIPQTAPIRDTESGLDNRRAWAQGQQSNPKYRTEAVWYIQNYTCIREVLLHHRADYIRFIESRMRSGGLDQLEMFIKGALVHGELTPLAEIAIAKQGVKLGIPADITDSSLDRLLADEGLERSGTLPDHYTNLGVHPHLPQDQLEAFYERRRRWATNINDREKFRRVNTELEAAWFVLGDPDRRKGYDHQYSRIFPAPPPLDDFGTVTPEPRTSEPEDGAPDVTEAEAEENAEALAKEIAGDSERSLLVPKLVVEAPDTIRLKPDRQPISMTIKVRNVGRGEMSGTVRVDQRWARVSPTELDPLKPEQLLTVTVNPMAMPEDRGEVRVTVSTRRCGSRTVVIESQRKIYVKQLLTAGAVLAAAALIGLPLLTGLQKMAESTQTHLVVRADPPTGNVSINGRALGVGGVIEAHEHFPIDEPFVIEVMADGYQAWEDIVTVPEGELVVITPRLMLDAELSFRPAAGESRSELSAVEVVESLRPLKTGIEECLTDSATTVRGYASPLGVLVGLEVLSGGDDSVRDCLTRQFRAATFPQKTTSTYSVFEYTL